MRVSTVLSLSALLPFALGSPYEVHERRHAATSHRWSKRAHLDEAAKVPIRIGLKQQNLEQGDAWLMEVSDPASERYGQHWSAKEVVDAFKPRYAFQSTSIGGHQTEEQQPRDDQSRP